MRCLVGLDIENLEVNVRLHGVADTRTGEKECVRSTPAWGGVFLLGLTPQADWHGDCTQLRMVRFNLIARTSALVIQP